MRNQAPFSSLTLIGIILLLTLLNIAIAFAGSPETKLHIVYLGERPHRDAKRLEESHHGMLATIVGSKELAAQSMVYSYKHGFSGFAAKLTQSQARELAECPGLLE